MRDYNQQEKELLDIISNISPSNQKYFGYCMQPLFLKLSIAVLLLKDDNEGYIFSTSSNNESNDLLISKIVLCISFLQQCERDNLIFCIEDSDYFGLFFHPTDSSDVAMTSVGNKYNVFNGTIIHENDNFKFISEKDGHTVVGTKIPQNLTLLLKHFFVSNLFPTLLLTKLKANDYQSEEEKSLHVQLKNAQKNFRIAIAGLFLSLFMPVISIFISNKLGYNTLENTQYKRFQNALSKIITILDDKSVNDSTITLPKMNKAIKKEVSNTPINRTTINLDTLKMSAHKTVG